MSTRESAITKPSAPSLTSIGRSLLQRSCSCGGSSAAGGSCEGCAKKRLQRSTLSYQQRDHAAPAIVHEVLSSSGQPLDAQTRSFMEGKFGHDFSKVRIHADDKAGDSAVAVDSLAYTVGNNLVFATGQYSPRTTQGTRLLAHELTHVVQQSGHSGAMQSLTIGRTNNRYEQEADRMAAFIAGTTAAQPAPRISALPGGSVQRACASCEEKDEEEKPHHKGFSYEDLMTDEVKEKEPEALAGGTPQKTSAATDRRPHFESATIECVGGDYVVKLNDWAGKPCGISDCVTVHESSHITDWRARWPKGCKKDDGSNQADGYLPTGGDGYDEFLKKSECTAHTKDLDCAEAKLKTATGDCKTKLEKYVKLTRDQKAGYC